MIGLLCINKGPSPGNIAINRVEVEPESFFMTLYDEKSVIRTVSFHSNPCNSTG